VSIRTWDGSIVAKATTACGFRTVRVGKRSSARLFNASSTACRFDCRKPVHRRDTSSVIDAKLSTASLCENPAVLRAQLRISGFTLGMETFWHAKGGARVFLSTLRIRRLPTRRFGHRGYAATREAAMAAFGSRGGASGPLASTWRRWRQFVQKMKVLTTPSAVAKLLAPNHVTKKGGRFEKTFFHRG
jgi:hypothetical protein